MSSCGCNSGFCYADASSSLLSALESHLDPATGVLVAGRLVAPRVVAAAAVLDFAGRGSSRMKGAFVSPVTAKT
jgi:hypothetical protein